jgi:hypothetical protein
MVYLDGKDEQGRTKYLNEDGARHTHLGSSQTQQQPTQTQQQPAAAAAVQAAQASTTIVTEGTLLKLCNAKLDRVIALLETLTTFVSAATQEEKEKKDV